MDAGGLVAPVWGRTGLIPLGTGRDGTGVFRAVRTDSGMIHAKHREVIAFTSGDPTCWETTLPENPNCGRNARMVLGTYAIGGSTLYATWTAEAVYNGVEP